MRRRRTKTHPAASHPRPARRIDADADPFATSQKVAEPAVCPRCGAVLHAGRWLWASAEPGAVPIECPACHRIAQDLPDGIVTIAGRFAEAHDTEIRNLIGNVEENERREHALARTFGIEAATEGLVVKTTERRLAASLGRALERAYGGMLTRKEGDRSSPLRVRWQRE